MSQPFKKQYGEIDTEYYTTLETVLELKKYLDPTKKYIEPFDRVGNSKIYAVLKALGFDIIHLRTDYNPKEDYEGRVIITNPPFISRGGLYSKMSRQCEEMYLLMPLFSWNCYTSHRGKDKCNRWSDNWEKHKLFSVDTFDTIDGTKKVSCVFTHWNKKDKQ